MKRRKAREGSHPRGPAPKGRDQIRTPEAYGDKRVHDPQQPLRTHQRRGGHWRQRSPEDLSVSAISVQKDNTRVVSALHLASIQRSAWKGYSAKFISSIMHRAPVLYSRLSYVEWGGFIAQHT